MNESLKILIIEDDSLLLKSIIETMFIGEISDRKMNIVSVVNVDEIPGIFNRNNFDLVFCSVSNEKKIPAVIKLLTKAYCSMPSPQQIIGVSNYPNCWLKLGLAGCLLILTPIKVCEKLQTKLKILESSMINA